MNKQQQRIFLMKILPKAIILILLFGGIIAFWSAQIYSHSAEKELKNIDGQKIIDEINKKITINKLSFLLGNWNIEKQYTFPDKEGEAGGIILSDKKEKVVFISYTTHKFISDLHEYSELANERTLRNMKPTGLILNSKKIEDVKFKGLDAVKETFESVYEPTGVKSEYISINLKYKEVFYTLGYTNESNSNNLISTIEFSY